jgi:hypothetical protein
MNKLILITLLALMTAACTKTKDDDGVPVISSDLENITVDGQAITAQAFKDAYCKLKPMNNTCLAVDHQLRLNDSKRTTSTRF